MRHLENRHWIYDTRKPQKHQTHTQLQQPTTMSWINKLRVTHMLRQTREGWNIHNKQTPFVQNTIKIWQQEWDAQKQILELIKTKTKRTIANKKNGNRTPKSKKLPRWRWGEINKIKKLSKLYEQHPGTPGPTTIKPEYHEAISRIMLKYPTAPEKYDKDPIPAIQCNTCRKTYFTYKGRNQHQNKSATCAIQKQNIKIYYICPAVRFGETFAKEAQLEKHLLYHCHEANTLKKLNKLNKQKAAPKPNDKSRCTK